MAQRIADREFSRGAPKVMRSFGAGSSSMFRAGGSFLFLATQLPHAFGIDAEPLVDSGPGPRDRLVSAGAAGDVVGQRGLDATDSAELGRGGARFGRAGFRRRSWSALVSPRRSIVTR